jgi:hypothetical protein
MNTSISNIFHSRSQVWGGRGGAPWRISFPASKLLRACPTTQTRTRLRPEAKGIRSGHGDLGQGGSFRVGSVPNSSAANKAPTRRGDNPQRGHHPAPTRRSSSCRARRRRHTRKRSPRPWRRTSSSTSPRGSAPSPPPKRSVRALRNAPRRLFVCKSVRLLWSFCAVRLLDRARPVAAGVDSDFLLVVCKSRRCKLASKGYVFHGGLGMGARIGWLGILEWFPHSVSVWFGIVCPFGIVQCDAFLLRGRVEARYCGWDHEPDVAAQLVVLQPF